MRQQALHPHFTAFFVHVLDAAAGVDDFVRAHAGVADKDQPVVGTKRVQDIQRGCTGIMTAGVVLPQRLVDAVVEVEKLQMLEFGPGRSKQGGHFADVVVHRAADVQKQQQFGGFAQLRAENQIQQAAVTGGAAERGVQVQPVAGTLAGKRPQPAQGNLHVARAQLCACVQVAEFALVPHLDGAPVARAILADADTGRIVAIGTERAGAAGADPFVAALMPLVLLGQPFLERAHQLIPAHALKGGLFFGAQVLFDQLAQPVFGNLALQVFQSVTDAVEVGSKNAVKAVVVLFILDEDGA